MDNKNPRQLAYRQAGNIDGVSSGISTPRDMWVPETEIISKESSSLFEQKLVPNLIQDRIF